MERFPLPVNIDLEHSDISQVVSHFHQASKEPLNLCRQAVKDLEGFWPDPDSRPTLLSPEKCHFLEQVLDRKAIPVLFCGPSNSGMGRYWLKFTK
jgi:hypothetical protein